MTQRKILYVINHMDWFWSHRLPLAKAALQDGWDVQIAAHGASSDERLHDHGFEGLELPHKNMLQILYCLHRMMRDQKPELVHAITLKYAFLAGLVARLHPHVKIVHTIAGLGYLFSGEGLKPKLLRILVGPFLKIALKGKNAFVIFQNPDDRDLMIRRGFVDVRHTFLIRGSGVDLQQFSYVKEPKSNPAPVVLMPTRLVHDKGIAVFLEAARIIKKRGIDAKFQIAGGVTSVNPRAISQTQMQNMVSDGAAEWLGRVDDMPALYAGCNLVVYPSYYGEGVAKVLLEAAAIGRAIITTDHPGCREAVDHRRSGLLVPVKDAVAVADAIQDLLQNETRRADMGKNARAKAEAEFDVRMIAQQTIAVYTRASAA
jgi:glycosyltransferase involved in cell wall biosynthesis